MPPSVQTNENHHRRRGSRNRNALAKVHNAAAPRTKQKDDAVPTHHIDVPSMLSSTTQLPQSSYTIVTSFNTVVDAPPPAPAAAARAGRTAHPSSAPAAPATGRLRGRTGRSLAGVRSAAAAAAAAVPDATPAAPSPT